MIRLLALLVAAASVACSACSGKSSTPYAIPGIPTEIDPSIAVSTPDGGVGHACPVEGYILTAKHVVLDEATKQYLELAWSDGYGNEGVAVSQYAATGLDLVTIEILDGPEPHYLPAYQALKPGDEVFWFEYDFRTQANVLRARRRFGKILRVVAQQILIDSQPTPGASGTCLINAKGEVVGVVVGAWETEDGKGAGSAVKLPLLPKKEAP